MNSESPKLSRKEELDVEEVLHTGSVHGLLRIASSGSLDHLHIIAKTLLDMVHKDGVITQLMAKSEREMFFTLSRTEDVHIQRLFAKIFSYVAENAAEYADCFVTDMNFLTFRKWILSADHTLVLCSAKVISKITEMDQRIGTLIRIADFIGISQIVSIAKSHDSSIRVIAACILSRFSQISQLRFRIVDDGGLNALITLARSGSQVFPYGLAVTRFGRWATDRDGVPMLNVVRGQYEAARAIANLTEEDNLLTSIAVTWVHLPLIALARHAAGETKVEAMRAITNLSKLPEFQVNAGRMGGVEIALQMIDSRDSKMRKMGILSLKNFSLNGEMCGLIEKKGGIPLLLHLTADVSDKKSVPFIFEILANLSRAEEAHGIIDEKFIPEDSIETNVLLELLAACEAELLDEDESFLMKMAEEGNVSVIMFHHVAFCLARKTRKEGLREHLRNNAGIPRVMRLTALRRVDALTETMEIIANLTIEYEGLLALMEFEIIEKLMDWIEIGNPELQSHCCRAVANASQDDDTIRVAVVEAGGLNALAGCLRSLNSGTRFNAARAFANLSVNETARSMATELGIFRQMVSIAKSSDSTAFQLQVVVALRNYATVEANQEAIVKEDCLEWFIELMTSKDDTELFRQILACFFNLSDSDKNKSEILRRGGVDKLADMLTHEDSEVARLSLSVLANLACERNVCRRLRRIGAMKKILVTTKSQHRSVVQQACRTIANASFDDEMRSAIVVDGGVAVLLGLLKVDNTIIQRLAMSALANIAVGSENRYDIAHEGGLQALFEILSSKKDPELTEYSLLCLRNLSTNDDEKRGIVEKGFLDLLVTLVRSSPVSTIRLQAVATLNNLSKSFENRRLMSKKGVLKSLVDLLVDCVDDRDLALQTISCIGQFLNEDRNRIALAEEHGCELIVPYLTHDDTAIQIETSNCLVYLAKNAEVATTLVHAGAVQFLIEMLQNSDVNVQKHATSTLSNLCAVEEDACVQVTVDGGIPVLYAHYESDEAEVRQYATSCLNLLRNSMKGAHKLSRERVELEMPDDPEEFNPHKVWLYAISSDLNCQRASVSTIKYWCEREVPYQEQFVERGGVKVLTYFIKHSRKKPDILCIALDALEELCKNEELLPAVFAGGLDLSYLFSYVEDCSNLDETVQERAARVITNLLLSDEGRDKCLSSQALSAVFGLCNSAFMSISLYALRLLLFLSRFEDVVVRLFENDQPVVKVLVDSMSNPEAKFQKLGLEILQNATHFAQCLPVATHVDILRRLNDLISSPKEPEIIVRCANILAQACSQDDFANRILSVGILLTFTSQLSLSIEKMISSVSFDDFTPRSASGSGSSGRRGSVGTSRSGGIFGADITALLPLEHPGGIGIGVGPILSSDHQSGGGGGAGSGAAIEKPPLISDDPVRYMFCLDTVWLAYVFFLEQVSKLSKHTQLAMLECDIMPVLRHFLSSSDSPTQSAELTISTCSCLSNCSNHGEVLQVLLAQNVLEEIEFCISNARPTDILPQERAPLELGIKIFKSVFAGAASTERLVQAFPKLFPSFCDSVRNVAPEEFQGPFVDLFVSVCMQEDLISILVDQKLFSYCCHIWSTEQYTGESKMKLKKAIVKITYFCMKQKGNLQEAVASSGLVPLFFSELQTCRTQTASSDDRIEHFFGLHWPILKSLTSLAQNAAVLIKEVTHRTIESVSAAVQLMLDTPELLSYAKHDCPTNDLLIFLWHISEIDGKTDLISDRFPFARFLSYIISRTCEKGITKHEFASSVTALQIISNLCHYSRNRASLMKYLDFISLLVGIAKNITMTSKAFQPIISTLINFAEDATFHDKLIALDILTLFNALVDEAPHEVVWGLRRAIGLLTSGIGGMIGEKEKPTRGNKIV